MGYQNMYAAGLPLECLNSNTTDKTKEKTKQKWNQKNVFKKYKNENEFQEEKCAGSSLRWVVLLQTSFAVKFYVSRLNNMYTNEIMTIKEMIYAHQVHTLEKKPKYAQVIIQSFILCFCQEDIGNSSCNASWEKNGSQITELAVFDI